MNIKASTSFATTEWPHREATHNSPDGQPWLQYRVKDAPDSSADNLSLATQNDATVNITQCDNSFTAGHVPVNPCENGSANVVTAKKRRANSADDPSQPVKIPKKTPETEVLSVKIEQLLNFPQGNFDHELKESLKTYARCIDNKQSLPASDCKRLIKYFMIVPKYTDPDQLDCEDLRLLIEARPYLINQLPVNKMTPDLYLSACKKSYLFLQYVPDTMKTDELCRAVTLEDVRALEHVPPNLIQQWLVNGFFDKLNEMNGRAICYIPAKERTDAHFQVSCKTYSMAMNEYPHNKPVSEKLLTIAIERCGSLEFCPREKITAELCELACKKNGFALRYVPENMKTAKLCQQAFNSHHKAFNYIPEAFKTFEMCQSFCKQDDSLTGLPEHLTEAQRTELYQTACLFGFASLGSMPRQYVTYDFLKSICIQKEYKHSPLAFAAYNKFSNFVAHDSARELYLLACKSSPDALEHLPDKMKSGEFLEIALNNISALQHIPSKKLDFNGYCLRVAVVKKMIRAFYDDTLMEKNESSDPTRLHQLIKSNKLPYVPTGLQFKVLSDPDFPLNDKLRFIESLDAPDYSFPARVTAAPLICQKSPVKPTITNLFFDTADFNRSPGHRIYAAKCRCRREDQPVYC